MLPLVLLGLPSSLAQVHPTSPAPFRALLTRSCHVVDPGLIRLDFTVY